MSDQGGLDLGRTEAVARHVEDIVDTASDPDVAVLVAAAAVAGEVLAGIGFEVGVDEALMVAIDRSHLAGPAIEDAEVTRCCAF